MSTLTVTAKATAELSELALATIAAILDQEADRKYAMQNELFDPLKDLFFDKSSAAAARAQRMSKFLKTLLVTAHSDKNPGNPEESEMMTKVITAMRRRLREKL